MNDKKLNCISWNPNRSFAAKEMTPGPFHKNAHWSFSARENFEQMSALLSCSKDPERILQRVTQFLQRTMPAQQLFVHNQPLFPGQGNPWSKTLPRAKERISWPHQNLTTSSNESHFKTSRTDCTFPVQSKQELNNNGSEGCPERLYSSQNCRYCQI